MNAIEIIRRDLELKSYEDEPIQDNPKTSRIEGNTQGRKFLSVAVIASCGQTKLDHPDAMRGENAVPEIWARRAQRFTLPEDDAYLLGWAYHIYSIAFAQENITFTTHDEFLQSLEKTEVNDFLMYLQSPDLKINKETLGIKNNSQLRLRMKTFLNRIPTANISEIDRAILSFRLMNYIMTWNEVFRNE